MSVRFERKSTLQYGLFYFELVYEPKQKPLVKLPFPVPAADHPEQVAVHNRVRPKAENYADRTWLRHVALGALWVAVSYKTGRSPVL